MKNILIAALCLFTTTAARREATNERLDTLDMFPFWFSIATP